MAARKNADAAGSTDGVPVFRYRTALFLLLPRIGRLPDSKNRQANEVRKQGVQGRLNQRANLLRSY